MIRLGNSGGDGKIGPTSSTPTLVPHPREPLGKPPFVCERPYACDLPAQTQLHPNVFTLWQEHIAKLFTSHPAIRYAAYARGGVQGLVTRQHKGTLWPWHVFILPLLRLHFATRECVWGSRVAGLTLALYCGPGSSPHSGGKTGCEPTVA